VTPQDIITEARRILNDTVSTRYRNTDTEMLGWVNTLLDIMVDVRPDLFSKIGSHTCTNGAEQTAAFTRIARVLDVRRVVGGNVILPADKSVLDAFSPDWYNATPAAAVNWMPGISPFKFYLSPPAQNTQSVEVQYAEAPATLTLTDPVPVSDNYQPALVSGVVGWCETKDDESVNSNRASQLKADFIALIKGVA